LDKESSGLLLLTNDGTLSHTITHPTAHVAKIYRVVVDRPFGSDDISRVLGGERVGMFDPHD
jgi:16S rRNA U516 pseudouridylate synthase RsuA-like enzyme